ncbi:glycoside hydrolase family 13 protein [Quadrisphaera sp. DSM 44207]|uniref:glycoside hydrolase family 13 protein n=1 Tax=Quadrisphaera sp. DSM 44207 TaxID=1881057 RepID=UPI000883A7E3|nr:glycoside hydrolase family 13 protein [Quadrisphaera sp. DSM 44207]SDQ06322.1 alpha-glucosidase [Quadrisphaera sp. DSM 44207]
MTASPSAPAPSSPTPPAGAGREWWRSAVIYQVYPRSFADADGDGIGDLPGITARLEHLTALGVDAVWLSPFYRSPQADAGYDVADYTDVDPIFGTLADADALIARAHDLGLRVVVDLVPNHTSDEHAWFQEALAAGPGSRARARYIFRDGRGPGGEQPPNDWRSVFGGRAWTRVSEPDGTPGQWYLHLFDSKQPDLDWSNPEVREHLEDVLRFWLDRGVDGFRVDVAHGLVKADGLPDWSRAHGLVHADPDGERAPMWDQDDVHEIYRSWRRVLDSYDGDRMMVAEAWVAPAERLARYVRPDEMHQAFNFPFLDSPWTAADLRTVVDASLAADRAVGAPTTWVLSNHDVVRHVSRMGLPVGTARPNGITAEDPQPDEELGLRLGRSASLLMLALPGSAYLYQGEELGLPDHTAMPHEARQDPAFRRTGGEEIGRDGCRVPMPWRHDAPGLGFGPSGRTWLPQPAAYARYAADLQVGVPSSTYEVYREALRLRREHDLGRGDLRWVELPGAGPDVLAFTTGSRGEVLVVTAFADAELALPADAEVLLASGELGTRPDGARVLPPGTTAWLRA